MYKDVYKHDCYIWKCTNTGKYYIDYNDDLCNLEEDENDYGTYYLEHLTKHAQEITVYDVFLGRVTFGGSQWKIDKKDVVIDHRNS
jgi:hypothetical protein